MGVLQKVEVYPEIKGVVQVVQELMGQGVLLLMHPEKYTITNEVNS